MSLFNHPRKKYLILLPMIFLLFNAFYFMYATNKIEEALVRQTFVNVRNSVDMLAAVVEKHSSLDVEEYVKDITESATFIDALPMTYCSAFDLTQQHMLIPISARNNQTQFDPFAYPEFSTAVFEQESGYFEVDYTPPGLPQRQMEVYFRWMPMFAPPDERYLVAVGVSVFSVETRIPFLVSIGQWVSTLFTLALNIWLVLLLARLGQIVELREGEKWKGVE